MIDAACALAPDVPEVRGPLDLLVVAGCGSGAPSGGAAAGAAAWAWRRRVEDWAEGADVAALLRRGADAAATAAPPAGARLMSACLQWVAAEAVAGRAGAGRFGVPEACRSSQCRALGSHAVLAALVGGVAWGAGAALPADAADSVATLAAALTGAAVSGALPLPAAARAAAALFAAAEACALGYAGPALTAAVGVLCALPAVPPAGSASAVLHPAALAGMIERLCVAGRAAGARALAAAVGRLCGGGTEASVATLAAARALGRMGGAGVGPSAAALAAAYDSEAGGAPPDTHPAWLAALRASADAHRAAAGGGGGAPGALVRAHTAWATAARAALGGGPGPAPGLPHGAAARAAAELCHAQAAAAGAFAAHGLAAPSGALAALRNHVRSAAGVLGAGCGRSPAVLLSRLAMAEEHARSGAWEEAAAAVAAAAGCDDGNVWVLSQGGGGTPAAEADPLHVPRYLRRAAAAAPAGVVAPAQIDAIVAALGDEHAAGARALAATARIARLAGDAVAAAGACARAGPSPACGVNGGEWSGCSEAHGDVALAAARARAALEGPSAGAEEFGDILYGPRSAARAAPAPARRAAGKRGAAAAAAAVAAAAPARSARGGAGLLLTGPQRAYALYGLGCAAARVAAAGSNDEGEGAGESGDCSVSDVTVRPPPLATAAIAAAVARAFLPAAIAAAAAAGILSPKVHRRAWRLLAALPRGGGEDGLDAAACDAAAAAALAASIGVGPRLAAGRRAAGRGAGLAAARFALPHDAAGARAAAAAASGGLPPRGALVYLAVEEVTGALLLARSTPGRAHPLVQVRPAGAAAVAAIAADHAALLVRNIGTAAAGANAQPPPSDAAAERTGKSKNAAWWAGRRGVDAEMSAIAGRLTAEALGVVGACMLRGDPLDPCVVGAVDEGAAVVTAAGAAEALDADPRVTRVLLAAAADLSFDDVETAAPLVFGTAPAPPPPAALAALQGAVARVVRAGGGGRGGFGPCVLVLGEGLHLLPWELAPIVSGSQRMTRLPSDAFVPPVPRASCHGDPPARAAAALAEPAIARSSPVAKPARARGGGGARRKAASACAGAGAPCEALRSEGPVDPAARAPGSPAPPPTVATERGAGRADACVPVHGGRFLVDPAANLLESASKLAPSLEALGARLGWSGVAGAAPTQDDVASLLEGPLYMCESACARGGGRGGGGPH